MSKAELSKEGQEWRRLRAWDLWQQGWKQKAIATALGVTKGAVSQWMKRGRKGGAQRLRRSIANGAEPRMSSEQRARLPEFLSQGAQAVGYQGNVWSRKLVAEVINRVFGISYHRDHCSRILRQEESSCRSKSRRSAPRMS